MALKIKVKSLDEVDEKFHSLYTKVGEEFVLDTDDGEYKTRISEFRDNNIELAKKIKALEDAGADVSALKEQLAAFEGLDAEAAREALKTIESQRDKKLIEEGKFDEVLAERTERMRSDFAGKTDALQKALDTSAALAGGLKEKLSKVVIDNALQTHVTAAGAVRQGAMQDVLARGRTVWSLNDEGEPVPTGPDGKVLYGKDAQKPISMEEWSLSLVDTAGYLFEASSGGGSNGGGNKDKGSSGRIIDAGDVDGLGANLEDIASGEVQVAMGG